MEEKVLGKITHAEFGQYPDRPFLFGLQLCFSLKGGGVCDGARYTLNISKECKWDRADEKYLAFFESLEELNGILTDAKVNYVSQLKNKPVEITLKNYAFVDFRILTEVL